MLKVTTGPSKIQHVQTFYAAKPIISFALVRSHHKQDPPCCGQTGLRRLISAPPRGADVTLQRSGRQMSQAGVVEEEEMQ